MATKERNESTLPQWAQRRLDELRRQLAASERRCEQTEKAHAVLMGRDWFTLPTWGDESRTFYMLRHDAATAICTVRGNDVLLVGRERRD